MFVWVMRDKGSEWKALQSTLLRGGLSFTPLVEAVCEPFIASEGKLTKTPSAVMEALATRLEGVCDVGPVWVDLANLLVSFSPADVAVMMKMLGRSRGLLRRRVVPVIRCSAPDAIVSAALDWARTEESGICIRVDGLAHLGAKALEVQGIASGSGYPAQMIDLVIDAQDLPRAYSHPELAHAFPLGQVSRTYTIVAGSFPRSITDMRPDLYEHRRPRDEWSAYCEEIMRSSELRVPTYGDFATQAAVYTPSPGFRASPTIRYTTSDEYVVLRGRANVEMAATQYIGHSRFLQSQSYFRSIAQTLGDSYVERMALGSAGTGNATTWRVASLQRHLGVVAMQVEALVVALAKRGVPQSKTLSQHVAPS